MKMKSGVPKQIKVMIWKGNLMNKSHKKIYTNKKHDQDTRVHKATNANFRKKGTCHVCEKLGHYTPSDKYRKRK